MPLTARTSLGLRLSAGTWSFKWVRRGGFIAFLVLLGATVVVVFWLLQREKSFEPPPEMERHREVRKAVLHHVSRGVVICGFGWEERRIRF